MRSFVVYTQLQVQVQIPCTSFSLPYTNSVIDFGANAQQLLYGTLFLYCSDTN